jgi:hypothetical protein
MRAGTRSQREVEMPMIATIIPSTTPMTVAQIEITRVFTSPTPSNCGKTCHIASKSKKVLMMLSSQSMVCSGGGG